MSIFRFLENVDEVYTENYKLLLLKKEYEKLKKELESVSEELDYIEQKIVEGLSEGTLIKITRGNDLIIKNEAGKKEVMIPYKYLNLELLKAHLKVDNTVICYYKKCDKNRSYNIVTYFEKKKTYSCSNSSNDGYEPYSSGDLDHIYSELLN